MKVSYIELHDYHEEVAYPFCKQLLDQGSQVDLFLNETFRSGICPQLACARLKIHWTSNRPSVWKWLTLFRHLPTLLRSDRIVLGSSETPVSQIAGLILAPLRPVLIKHNLHRMSLPERLLLAIARKIVVLGDFLEVPQAYQHKTVSFLPVTLPRPPVEIAKELLVVIPGKVESSRRDYRLLDQALAHEQEMLDAGLRIDLLGDISRGDGPRLSHDLEPLLRSGLLEVHHQRVSSAEFYQTASRALVILPLVRADAEYFRTKTTAALNLAIGSRSFFALPQSLREYPLGYPGILYYDPAHFGEFLLSLQNLSKTPVSFINPSTPMDQLLT